MAVRILVTDPSGATVGRPLGGWSNLDVTVRHMTAGAGTFTVPESPAVLAQLAAGNSIVIVRRPAPGLPQQVFASGPLEGEPGEWVWQSDGSGRITVPFSTDEVYAVERITWPVPSQPANAQTAAAAWTMSGNAETVMRALADATLGAGAHASRRLAGFALGPVAGVGGTVSISTRYQPLGDELRALALAGGGLGWRIRRVGTQRLFEVFAPIDRTGTVRFSRGLGNLRRFRWAPASPTCNVAVVGGQGEGTARVIRERVNTGSVARWQRRIERFVDQRQTELLAELDQAGDEALTEGAESVGLETETVDTDRQRYGVAFGLGDRVAVELGPGAVIPDVVTAAQLVAKAPEGERVTCTVGNRPASTDLAWLAEARRIRRRLAKLEAV